MKNVRSKKRIIGLLTVMMMIFTMLPGMAFAAGGSEVKVQINDGGSEFTVKVDELIDMVPTVKNVPEGEDYHVHWVKVDGKKYIKFVKNNGTEVAENEVVANKIKIKGIEKTTTPAKIAVKVVSGECSDSCAGAVLAEKQLAITVVADVVADPYAYAAQGKDVSKQSVLLVTPSDITQLYPNADGQSNSLFVNEISGKLDSTNKIQFVFKMGKGMGDAYDEAAFIENGIKNIAIYDADESTVIASYEKGNLKFLGRDNETDRNLTIELDADALAADTKYVLVFGEDMAVKAGADKLGADVKFNFATKKAKTEKPTNPADPTVPGDGNQNGGNGDADKSDKVPQTGDESNMVPFIVLMILSMAVMGTTVVARKRQ